MATRKALPRFFIDPSSIDAAAGLARVGDAALTHQMRNVLRLKEGNRVHLLDGQGGLYEAELVKSTRTFIEFCIQPRSGSEPQKAGQDPATNSTTNSTTNSAINSTTKSTTNPETNPVDNPPFRLFSCLPLIRAHRFEWALEKLCELGVFQILPFQSERCQVKLKSSEQGRSKRWQTICREASEQCERLLLPEVLEPETLEDLLRHHAPAKKSGGAGEANKIKLLLSERNREAPDMVSALCNRIANASSASGPLDVLVLGGPEGGFADQELQLIAAHGFAPVTLGGLVLRSETACILAAGLVSAVNATKTKEN